MLVGSGLAGNAADDKTNLRPVNGDYPLMFHYRKAAMALFRHARMPLSGIQFDH